MFENSHSSDRYKRDKERFRRDIENLIYDFPCKISDDERNKIDGIKEEMTDFLGTIFGSEEVKFEIPKIKKADFIDQYEKISDKNFSRIDFKGKTGSETTLIGGPLKNKAIIRHIEPEAFMVWQKAYEDYELWEQSGFDYVPIEPILSFKLNRAGLVDVYSGVLDLNLQEWRDRSDKFLTELDGDRDKIVEVLFKNGIRHRHSHDSNFCLRFFRDEKGDKDFSKKPRIYLIDFDAAMFV